MRHKHKSEGDDKGEEPVFIDNPLDTDNNQGQVDKPVQPHRVHKLNDNIAHEGVHHGEDKTGVLFTVFGVLKVIEECNSCCTHLTKLHNKERFGHHGAGQEHRDKHKGTCEIVGEHTDDFPGEISAE